MVWYWLDIIFGRVDMAKYDEIRAMWRCTICGQPGRREEKESRHFDGRVCKACGLVLCNRCAQHLKSWSCQCGGTFTTPEFKPSKKPLDMTLDSGPSDWRDIVAKGFVAASIFGAIFAAIAVYVWIQAKPVVLYPLPPHVGGPATCSKCMRPAVRAPYFIVHDLNAGGMYLYPKGERLPLFCGEHAPSGNAELHPVLTFFSCLGAFLLVIVPGIWGYGRERE